MISQKHICHVGYFSNLPITENTVEVITRTMTGGIAGGAANLIGSKAIQDLSDPYMLFAVGEAGVPWPFRQHQGPIVKSTTIYDDLISIPLSANSRNTSHQSSRKSSSSSSTSTSSSISSSFQQNNASSSVPPRNKQLKPTLQCQFCKSTIIDKDESSGTTTCTGCGAVLEENCIVSSVQFSETGNGGTAIIGQFVSATSWIVSVTPMHSEDLKDELIICCIKRKNTLYL